MSDPEESRGFRNRNGLNVKYDPRNKWRGQTGMGDEWLPEARREFARFETHELGIRAGALLLTAYYDRYGLRTIRELIRRWAPPVENATDAYVGRVAEHMNRGADEVLDLHQWADLRPLVEAMIVVELGGNPYSSAQIDRGLELAGVPRPVTTVREAAATSTGHGAITVGAAAAAAAAAAPALEAVARMPQWVGVATVLAAAVAAVLVVLARRRAEAT